jgi:hypothetical protein
MAAGTANLHFAGAGHSTGSGNAFEEVIFNSDTYSVLAVPEPISTVPLVCDTAVFCPLETAMSNPSMLRAVIGGQAD